MTDEWVKLSPDDRALCVAQAARIVKEGKGSDDPTIRARFNRYGDLVEGNEDQTKGFTIGLAGELVVHRALGTEPAWVAGQFDGGKDGVLSTGHTWDSKVVRKAPRFLPVPPTLPQHADCYILVKHDSEKKAFRIVGWDYWLRIARYVPDYLPGMDPETREAAGKKPGRKSHLVPATDLRPWDDFARIHNDQVERFTMRLGTKEYPVSINHKRHAVKIGDVVYDREAFAKMVALGSDAARKAHEVMQAFDGEFHAGSDGDIIPALDLVREKKGEADRAGDRVHLHAGPFTRTGAGRDRLGSPGSIGGKPR